MILFFLGYGLGLIHEVLDIENMVIPILSSVIGTIYYNYFYYVLMFFLSREIPREVMLQKVFSIEILYNGILALLLYKLFSKIFVIPSLRFGKR